ncbi:MAG TPA: hypothetical protein P5114_12610 [Hyphomicrobiaceae bacterium]|nr:hypothetical protein [Hyphomicrobiaceae bacterium]
MLTTLNVVYRGETLQGEMDALLVSDAIRGSIEYFNIVAKFAYGTDVSGRGRVTTFKRSSFEIQQILDIARETTGLAVSAYPLIPAIKDLGALISLAKTGFDLLLHLKGEKPKKVIYADNGSVSVENNSGTINVYNHNTVNLILKSGASKATRKFIGNPIATEAEEMEVSLGENKILRAQKGDAASFRDVTADLGEHVSHQNIVLRVISPVLEGEAQWRFNDGARAFPAKIEDQMFLTRVYEGVEKFGKGDKILARVRTLQTVGPRGGLKSKYFVEEVLGRPESISSQELPL